MIKEKIFSKVESPIYPKKYIVVPDHEKFHLESTEGSFAVIAARLLGLSYPNYLRLCRDAFGAEIIGKNEMYPVAYFTRSEGLDALISYLNASANFVLWEREHPDFQEQEQFVEDVNPEYYKSVRGE